jgi:lactate dehydrogenase-like 2-hydroxyacid dehydrogenase
MPAMNDLPRVPVLGVAKLSPLFAALIRERHELLDRLHETDPAAFEAAAPRIRAVAAGGDSRVDAGLIARLPALQIISVMGVGYDGIDVEAARARGVVVTHTPNVLNDEVADLAIGLMLAAARQLPAADRYVRSGHWEGRGPMPLARKMSGSRLGIVGMGRIGQAIAHRAQAFGMPIAYTARSAKPGLPYRFVASVEELAAGSDFLVLITPGGEGTRHLVDAKVLRALGPKGILVNVARGSVVDEAALVDALEQGVLGGAALDVFEDEPRVPARLLALPHVVVAPHIGSATHSTRQAMADRASANLQARLAGQPLLTPVPECA